MQTRSDSILRAINENGPMNILTGPTHERFQSNWSLIPHNFTLINKPGFKPWNEVFAKLPSNHTLVNNLLPNTAFDAVISQNKFGQYQEFRPLSERFNIPLISLEHTLPVPQWSPKQRQALLSMTGNVNVFISEYSVKEWGFQDAQNVDVIHHGINTEQFSDKDATHDDGKVLTVVNDYVNRDWCFPAGTKITTKRGCIPIEEVLVGDFVLTKSGVYHQVTKLYKRDFKGHLVNVFIDNYVSPIPMTVGHRVYIKRGDIFNGYLECEHIKNKDLVVFPEIKTTSGVDISEDHAWAIGFIVGRAKIDGDILTLRFSNDEMSVLDRIRKMGVMIDNDISIIKDSSKPYIRCVFKNEKILTLMKSVPSERYIPDLIFFGKNKARISFIIGLMDACCVHDSSEYMAIGSKSGYLCHQLRLILSHFGINATFSDMVRKDKHHPMETVKNWVKIHGQNLDRLCRIIVNTPESTEPTEHVVTKTTNDYFEGEVYNIEVEHDPSYVVNDLFVVHNCCGWSIYKEAVDGLPVNPVGDTKGFSLPATDTDDLVNKYRNASVFLNTSTISPVPTSLLEAMSCGNLVVSTSTCMLPEIIQDGYNGFISNDVKYLKDRLIWALEHHDEAMEIGKNARKTIEEKFSLSEHIRKWTNLFEKVRGQGFKI